MTRATQRCWSCCGHAVQQQTLALMGLAACQTSLGMQLSPILLLVAAPNLIASDAESSRLRATTLDNMAYCVVMNLL
jgi:hypothetical protein